MVERAAYLVTGAISKDQADSCSAVTALTGDAIEIGVVTPAGVLLVRPSGTKRWKVESPMR